MDRFVELRLVEALERLAELQELQVACLLAQLPGANKNEWRVLNDLRQQFLSSVDNKES